MPSAETLRKSRAAKRLAADEDFREFLADVKQEQADVFLNPASTEVAREEAHAIVRALDKIEARVRRSVNTLMVVDRNAERDQDREND